MHQRLGTATSMETRISARDRRRLTDARSFLIAFLQRLAHGALHDVVHEDPEPHATYDSAHGADVPRSRWFGRERAFRAVHNQSEPGCFAHFDFPYGSFEHEASSHAMGTGSLVAESLEVKALPNVYVAGPGTFPRMGAANPALTILAISRWLGTTLGHSL